MKYLFDTDHLSILQRQTGQSYSNLAARIATHPSSDFSVSIITFHEQILGCHAYINRDRALTNIVKGYEMMTRLVNDFKVMPIVPFDTDAAIAFEQLQAQRIQLAKMDARIAAIALSRGLTLLTRNSQDFSKVAGIKIEDWTI